MNFKIELDLDNAAFEGAGFMLNGRSGAEIARILRGLANLLDGADVTTGDYASLHDANGNFAGRWSVAR
jgi:hypothetical protein